MSELLKRILFRAKKLAVLLLVIPILAAGIGYVFAEKQPASYIAEAEIMLGSYEQDTRNNPALMKKKLTSELFIKKLNENYDLDLDIDELKSRLLVEETVSNKTLKLSFNDQDEKVAEQTLTKLVDGIMRDSEEWLNKRKTRLEKSIKRLEGNIENTESIEAEVEPATTEKVLSDQYDQYEELEDALVTNDVTVSPSNFVSPVQRAIFGLLIGIIISALVLLLPELFREEKN
jgi:teichuronic acid biosynthesis protein TuaF